MEDKIPAEEISEKSDFLRWLSNFWYHNKTITIVTLFVIFVVLITTLQMCSQESEDVTLVYGGPAIISNTQFDNVRSVINAVMPKDFNGDGRKYTEIIVYNIMTEEQFKEFKERLRQQAEAEESGAGADVILDSSYYSKQYETYRSILLTGEYSIYLLDPWLFNELLAADRLQKVTDIAPGANTSFSEYGVRLSDTAIYNEYEALQVLPGDTVVCLLKPYVFGASSKEKNYAIAKEMFAKIVE